MNSRSMPYIPVPIKIVCTFVCAGAFGAICSAFYRAGLKDHILAETIIVLIFGMLIRLIWADD